MGQATSRLPNFFTEVENCPSRVAREPETSWLACASGSSQANWLTWLVSQLVHANKWLTQVIYYSACKWGEWSRKSNLTLPTWQPHTHCDQINSFSSFFLLHFLISTRTLNHNTTVILTSKNDIAVESHNTRHQSDYSYITSKEYINKLNCNNFKIIRCKSQTPLLPKSLRKQLHHTQQ